MIKRRQNCAMLDDDDDEWLLLATDTESLGCIDLLMLLIHIIRSCSCRINKDHL